jgi:hypothetical protein
VEIGPEEGRAMFSEEEGGGGDEEDDKDKVDAWTFGERHWVVEDSRREKAFHTEGTERTEEVEV